MITCSRGNVLPLSFWFFRCCRKHFTHSLNRAVILITVDDHLLQREFLFTLGEHGKDGLSVWHEGGEKCSSSCAGEIQTSCLKKKKLITLATSGFNFFFLITLFTKVTKKTMNCVCLFSNAIHYWGGETTAISSWQSITLSSCWVIKWCLRFPWIQNKTGFCHH